MSDERPPARPWFDLVIEEAAVRGWGVAELARRARIGRPTVYGWRDNTGKPQAGPVNAVADTLGIARERALRLAGIIGIPRPPQSVIPHHLYIQIMTTDGLTLEQRQAVAEAVERTLTAGRASEGSSPPSPADQERHRPAS